MGDGTGGVTVVHGIPESLRAEAAAMYDAAFGAKLGVAIPSPKRRVALLERSMNLSCAFAAIRSDRLLGLAGYQTRDGALTDGITWQSLRECLGIWGATRAAAVLSLYERPLQSEELLMDGIVVDAGCRGQGIGTKLLDGLANWAGTEGWRALRLDVIDTNTAARRMYERNGFVATETVEFGYLRWWLGFGASTTLVRDVGPAGDHASA